ncbi:unnamed protein product [Scytosiphon promiscuus]
MPIAGPDEENAEDQPLPGEASSLPEEIIQQILRFFPVDQALRCARTSRAFSRASLASLRSASPVNGMPGCGASCCCCGSNVGSFGSGSNGDVGTPFLDLRAGGDAVDCQALSALLRRVFGKPEDTLSTAADGTRSVTTRSFNPSPSTPSTSGRPAALKGLALRSAAVRDEGIRHALERHGEGLEALDLGGCSCLDTSLTVASMRKWCKHLAALDISGTALEQGRGSGYISSPMTPLRLPAGRRPQELGTVLDGHESKYGSEGTGRFKQENVDRLEDCHLVSLLSGGMGRGLLSLRLRDRPFITDEGVGAIASCCMQLRELDIGTRRRLSQTGKITGQALLYLSAAPCAQSLVSLGLRNRHSIGHLNLRALGTQFPGLKKLDLAGLVKVDHAVLKALALTLSLTHVDLSRAHHVSVAGVAALAVGSPELECISLHGIGLADGAVRALCDACPRLRHINVSMTRVTERSLRLLAVKDSLRWANIRCCCDLRNNASTYEVLAAFRNRLSAPKHPRDRGLVLGMERPEPQQRARTPPPKRSSRRSLDDPSAGRRASARVVGGPVSATGGDAQASSNSHGQGALARTSTPAVGGAFREGGGDGGDGGGSRSSGDGHLDSDVGTDRSGTARGDQATPLGGGKGGDGREALAVAGGAERSAGDSSRRTSSIPVLVPVASSTMSSVPSSSAERDSGGGEETQAALVRQGVPDPESSPGSAAATKGRTLSSPRSARPEATPTTGSAAADLTGEAPAREAPGTELPGPAALAPAQASASSPPPAAAALSAAQPRPSPLPPPPEPAAMSPKSSPGDRPLPLLPAGVGDLSLGQNRRRVGAQRRSPREGQNQSRDYGKTQEFSAGGEPGEDTLCPRGEDSGRGQGLGAGGYSTLEGGVVEPFHWDTIPRGSGVGDLGGWKGFRGMSGDLVKNVIRELHPYAQVDFRAKPDSQMGPPTRKISHGYLVHTSKWGQAWVEFEVDEQGCIA